MVAFATESDLQARWSLAPEGEQALAVLEDASVWLQAMYSLPDNPSEKLASVLRIIVCSMAKRALQSENTDHMESLSQTAGPFSQSSSFRNSEGNLFLTKAEREMLDKALDEELNRSRGMRTIEAGSW
ncbi:Gp19/Gp15/Gp42 family protein [Corynebacterium accolens]|uniref:Gp19/Gp15/Gp42 family protein n=1 Tax=Corynebacterium accolens TaxID=38284 RepID=UPI00254C32A6|nr:Gp19/Gp15/Gp42 family protein [Corynebacterium accolens]MDK8497566.1 Gp19/Gp15/Gp42 family protein [Corynebacterium accolens]